MFRDEEIVILNDNFRMFLKMKSKDIKYNFIINYLLCNYFDDAYNDELNERIFILRKNFKNFLKKNKKYIGDDYNIEGVKDLVNNFINKKIILITI